jgi:hypothetical protein
MYFFGPTDQKLWVFEVWAGRACVGANEEELTNHKKICGQEGGRRGARGYNNGGFARARSVTSNRPRAATCTSRRDAFK